VQDVVDGNHSPHPNAAALPEQSAAPGPAENEALQELAKIETGLLTWLEEYCSRVTQDIKDKITPELGAIFAQEQSRILANAAEVDRLNMWNETTQTMLQAEAAKMQSFLQALEAQSFIGALNSPQPGSSATVQPVQPVQPSTLAPPMAAPPRDASEAALLGEATRLGGQLAQLPTEDEVSATLIPPHLDEQTLA